MARLKKLGFLLQCVRWASLASRPPGLHWNSFSTLTGFASNSHFGSFDERGLQSNLPLIGVETANDWGTVEWRGFLVTNTDAGRKYISPWHDLPLRHGTSSSSKPNLYTMVVEIPAYYIEKIEISKDEEYNPLRQDRTSTGDPRRYAAPIYWSYGFLPRTWSDPNSFKEGYRGDGDPIDVVDVSFSGVKKEDNIHGNLKPGSILSVKVLGALPLVDHGELDWKVLCISTSDPNFNKINDVQDIEKAYPGTVSGIREWFRWYKISENKPLNQYLDEGKPRDHKETEAIIEEAHKAYQSTLGR